MKYKIGDKVIMLEYHTGFNKGEIATVCRIDIDDANVPYQLAKMDGTCESWCAEKRFAPYSVGCELSNGMMVGDTVYVIPSCAETVVQEFEIGEGGKVESIRCCPAGTSSNIWYAPNEISRVRIPVNNAKWRLS